MSRAHALTAVRIAAVIVVTVSCIRLAWMSDDALITLRTALNLTHGWGPGTTPPRRFRPTRTRRRSCSGWRSGTVTGAWSTGILVAGVALTAAASAMVFWTASTVTRVAVTAALLVLSSAFVEYATSGLENPLGYAVMGALVLVGARVIASTGRDQVLLAIVLGLTTALALLTRAAYLLLILPAAVYTVWRLRSQAVVLVAMATAALGPDPAQIAACIRSSKPCAAARRCPEHSVTSIMTQRHLGSRCERARARSRQGTAP